MSLDAAIDALRANDGGSALAELLVAWRATHDTSLASAVIALGDRVQDATTSAIGEVIAGNAAQAAERARALERLPADPRVLAAVLRWIADPPYHATASQPFWRAAFALLARDGDASLREPLAAAARAADGKIRGATMRAWLGKQIAALALAGVATPLDEPTTTELARALAAFAPRAGVGPRPAAKASLEEALLAELRAHPHDDAPRAVYADWLAERGDPRGEFIALQLERRRRLLAPGEAKRELELLKKHAKAWVGEPTVALPYFTQLVSPELPAELARVNNAYFDRGFLARACLTHFKTAQLVKLAGHPAFATVEDFVAGRNAHADDLGARFAAFLAHPSLLAMRRLHVPADLAPIIADGPHAARIVELTTVRYHHDAVRVYEAAMRLPALAKLTIVTVGPSAADAELAATWRARIGDRVRIEIVDWRA